MTLGPGTCRFCGSPVTVDEAGKVVSHPAVASCASLAPPADDAHRRDLLRFSELGSPCCKFFGVGNTLYKGIYLPSVEEYVAHGYRREGFERAMLGWHASIDATGRP